MPIEFRCSGCQRMLRTPDESAGQKARCPGCGLIVGVPTATANAAGTPSDMTPEGAAAIPGDSGLTGGGGPSREPRPDGFRAPANPFTDGSGRPTSPSGGGAVPDNANPFGIGGVGAPRGYAATAQGANPYAAPTMAPPPQFVPSGSALQHRLITIEQLLKTTWEFLRDQFWMAVLLGLILLALGFVTALITTPLNIAAQATNDVRVVVGAQVLGQFLSVFVQVFIQLGGVITALHWARTGTIDIAQVFKAGTFYLRGLGLTLLIQLITLGVLLICAIPLLASIPSRNEDQMIVCGVLGLLVAMPIIIWLTLNWYIAMPILVDRNSSIREAMSLSRFYMAGNRLTVFVTNLVFGLISLPVVICTCGLGAIPLAPVASLFLVLVYLVSTGQTFHQPGIQPVLAYPNQGFPSPLQAGPQMPPVPPATPPAAGQDNPFSRPPGSLS